MAKSVAKRNVGMEILEGLRQLKRGDVSRVINVPPVATIRERTGLSQAKFASLLGVSVRTGAGRGDRDDLYEDPPGPQRDDSGDRGPERGRCGQRVGGAGEPDHQAGRA